MEVTTSSEALDRRAALFSDHAGRKQVNAEQASKRVTRKPTL